MKRIFKITLVTAVFLSAFIIALPYSVQFEPIQAGIARKAGSSFGIHLRIENAEWRWLPYPEVTVSGVAVDSGVFSLSADEMGLGFDWLFRFDDTPLVKAVLKRPDLNFKTLETKEKEPAADGDSSPKNVFLPSMSLDIENGRVLLPSDGFLRKLAAHQQSTPISGIDLSAAVSGGGVDLAGACRLPFAQRLAAELSYRPEGVFPKDESGDRCRLDVKAVEIDMTAVREQLLLLLGDDEIVNTVCGIILGGRAKEAAFLVDGSVSDLSDFDAMRITAVADNLELQVPGADLHLENTSGVVEIKNAVLFGRDLSTALGRSNGRNGTLMLALSEDSDDFTLDIEIDAYLPELPPLLHRLIDSPVVREEIEKIDNVRGRAQARLMLGDSLDSLQATVHASDIDCMADYSRLKGGVQIKGGRVSVFPEKVKWEDIEGAVGTHLISASSGSVDWRDGVMLDVDRFDAGIDAGFLYDELVSYPALEKALSELLSSVKGRVSISEFKLSGNVEKPEKMTYGFSASSDNLNAVTPQLPGSVQVRSASVSAGSDHLFVTRCDADIAGGRMNVTADFKHDFWKGWLGTVLLDGDLSRNMGEWLKEKDWIPPFCFPQTPCELNPLVIRLGQKDMDVKGRAVFSGGNGKGRAENKVTADMDFNLSPGGIALKKLSVMSAREKASLSFELARNFRESIKAGFSGELSAATLDSILDDESFTTGRMKGEFSLDHIIGKRGSSRLQGPLSISGFRWHDDDGNEVEMEALDITGRGALIDVDRAAVEFNGETVTAEGNIELTKNGMRPDLNIRSDCLSLNDMINVFNSIETGKEKRKKALGAERSMEKKSWSGYTVNGRLGFDLNCFTYETGEKQAYVWKPLSGAINLMPEGKSSINVDSGKICGITTVGSLSRPPGQSVIKISASKEDNVDFKDLMACIGLADRRIEGPVILDIKAEGALDNLEGGSFHLSSEKGVIYSMTTFSKILTVLNVTDLFTRNPIRNFFSRGFRYSSLEITGTIKENRLEIDRGVIYGDGLNLFCDGEIDLGKMEADLVVLASPLKILDAVLVNLPFVGKKMGGENKSVFSVAVSVKGPLSSPHVSSVAAEKIENSVFRVFRRPSVKE